MIVWVVFDVGDQVHVVPCEAAYQWGVEHCVFCQEGACTPEIREVPGSLPLVIHGPKGEPS